MRGFIEFLNTNAGVLSLIFSFVVTLATVVYALLTWRLVSETIRMRKAQTDAKVTVSVDPHASWMSFLDFAVRNEGVGGAYDVKFQVDLEPLGVGDQTLVDEIRRLGFIELGVSYLSPGQRIGSFLTSLADDYELKVQTKIRVGVTYRTASGEHLNESYLIDFAMFRNITQLGEPEMVTIAKSIKDLQKDVHNLSTGSGKLEVVTQDKESLRREQKARHAMWVERTQLERLARKEAADGEA